MYRKISKLVCIGILSVILLSSLSAFNLGLNFPEVKAELSGSSGWFYSGWQYRKAHNITQGEISSTPRFYDVSEPWITISGDSTGKHAFQPVHNTTIVAVDKIVDGALQKYLAYDSDADGTEIRLYYTNDTAGYWVPYSGNPILGPSAFRYRWPSTAYVNGTFHMFLTDRTDLTLERWTSTDGIHYTFRENVKVGGNQWKSPFIWFNANDNRWYLYTHDAMGGTEYVKVRNATSIENLASAVDTIVLSVQAPFGAASVMYYDGIYWLVAEILEGNVWKTVAYYSATSPSSGFNLVTNSPILSNDEACAMLMLNPNQTRAYLFVNRDYPVWYQETREVYLNSTIFPEAPDLANYQVRINAYYGSGSDGGTNVYLNSHSKTDFGDVRFTWLNSSSGLEQECSYWVEKVTIGNSALFWVKIPEISSDSNDTIYIYYGKPDASTASSGANTFDFFDDFSADLSKWTTVNFGGSGSASIVNGWVRISTQADGDFWGYTDSASGIFKAMPLNDNYAIETVFRQQSYPTTDAHNRFFMSRTSTASNSAFYVMLFDDDSSHITTNWRDSTGAYTGWAGENTGWNRGSQTTFYARLTKSGSTFSAYASPNGDTWNSVGTRSGNYHGYIGLVDSYHDGYTEFDWVRVRKYVNPEPIQDTWGVEETDRSVVIDQTFVSASRANVSSIQIVGFHAKWSNNGSDIIGGRIYVNNTEYVTNTTGWIDLSATSPVITRKTWVITGVNCSGVTLYTQTAPTPSIVWDQIKITDGGITKNPITLGETTTIWFKAKYEYDNAAFDGTHGILYLNTLPMSWSTINNRWEYYYTANITGGVTFSVSNVLDNLYNLTAMNDSVGPQFVDVLSLPFSVISNSTISELAFNSTSKILSFTVNGASGTTGFTNVTMSKSLLSDIGTLKVYLDGNEINYSTTSTEYYWIIQITYSHSAHKVTVILDSSQPTTTTTTPDTSKTTRPSTMPPSTSESTAPDTILPDTPQPTPPNNSPPDSSQPTQPDPATFNLLTSVVVLIMAALLAVPVMRRITPCFRGEKKTAYEKHG